MKTLSNTTKTVGAFLMFSLCAASVSAQADTVIGTLGTPTGEQGTLDNGEAFVQTLTTFTGTGYTSSAPTTGTVQSFALDVTGNSGAAFNVPGYTYDVPINAEAYIGIFDTSTNSITSVLYASGSFSIAPTATDAPVTFSPNLTYSLGANQALALIISDYSYSVGSAPATYTATDLNSFDNPYDNSSVASNYNNAGGAFYTAGNGGSQGDIYGGLTSTTHLNYTADISAVTPEPSTWTLLVAGIATLGFIVRRRSKV